MWSLRPKPLPAEFPFQALPIPILRCVSSAPGGQGLRHADPKGKETVATQSPKAPCTLCSQPWAVCTHCPRVNLPWAPALLHTLLWPKGFSLRISDFIAPSTLGFSHTRHLELGHIRGLLALPTHLYSQPGLCPPSTDLALYLFLLPRAGCGLAQRLHSECHTCVASIIRPSVLLPMGPGPEANCLLRKGKAKA